MKKLFYVRHGETDHNLLNIMSGQVEAAITENGRQQATQTGKAIKANLPHIDLIVCSPLKRTYETAKVIAKEIGYPESKIITNDLFVERTFGVLEGTSSEDFFKDHEYRDLDKVEGAETIEDLDKRAAKAFKFVSNLPQDNILIVGHGSFGRAIRRVTKNLPHTHEYESFEPIANAEIVELV
ncbi:MAG: histidine phosphatase family protein [Candidatus Saccharimonadales bacterium]